MTPPDVRTAGWAVAVVFFVNGASFANWVARVPAVKDALDAGTGSLGVALLGVAVGSLTALPFAGRLCDRFGSRQVVVASGLGLSITLVGLALAPTVAMLGVALAFYGGSFGVLDVAMNVQAVAVLRILDRPLMPLFHAAFSIGGLVGAGTGGLAAGVGLSTTVHFAIAGCVTAVAVLAVRRSLMPDAEPHPDAPPRSRRRRRRPELAVIGLGLIACSAALSEGAMADWTALFLRDERGLAAGTAALGFAAFSVAMTAGRLGGEAAIRRFGEAQVLRVGGLASAAGIVAAVVVDAPAAAFVGFGLVGLGMSCAFPLAISTAGEGSDGSGGSEIATVAVIGYAGFLVGPPFIGLLAEAVGLSTAMLVVTVPSLALVALAPVTGWHRGRSA